MSENYRSARSWSLTTIAGLAFVTLFQAGTALIGFGQILSPDMALDLDEDGVISAWAMIWGLLALFQFPVFVFTVVSFLIWLNRAHKNLLALRPSFLRFSSGWAVGWWFIPFANLVRPFQVVREVWWESDPEIPEDRMFLTESLHSAPTYMGVWWAFWLLSNFASNLLDRLFDPERMENVAEIGALMVVASSLTIVAGILAIMVVKDITARQSARFAAVNDLEAKETEAKSASPTVPSEPASDLQENLSMN
ncbi:MAG: DUF4328 domain-containing protein [Chloracidobacterium sp.]|nr:DUF4328 domain-containing protein [Chloracidobacterium sp.]